MKIQWHERYIQIFCVLLMMCSAQLAWADTDDSVLIPVQGLLTDAHGKPINQSTRITFNLYADAEANEAFWTETQSVHVENGLFTAYMGSLQSLNAATFRESPTPYLALKVEDDEEMDRWALGKTALAAYAQLAGDAQTLQGKTLEEVQGVTTAEELSYDNSASDLTAENTQAAIDEVLRLVQALESRVSESEQAQSTTMQALAELSSYASELEDEVAQLSLALQSVETQTTQHASQLVSMQSTLSGQGTVLSGLTSKQTENVGRLDQLTNTVEGQGSAINTLQTQISDFEDRILDAEHLTATYESRVSAVEHKLEPLRREEVEGYDALVFDSINLHVRNGLQATDETPNGLGNIIIGYNEPRTTATDVRTGSHNLVVGKQHNYSSYGGLVVGQYNTISGQFSSVSGGVLNEASGAFSAVCGGEEGQASGESSAVNGGYKNEASAWGASVSGGNSNKATAMDSVVSGGNGNTASGMSSVVGGGASVVESRTEYWRAGTYSSK